MNAKVETAKAPETKAATPAPSKDAAPMVSLKAICAELKLDPRLAREKLRIVAREAKKFPELAKAHKPRSAWEWGRRVLRLRKRHAPRSQVDADDPKRIFKGEGAPRSFSLT